MKNTIVCIIFFCCLNLYSQGSSGKIIYNIQSPNIETASKDPKSVLLKKMMVENAKNQSFTLEFNKNRSSFVRNAKLDLPSGIEKIVDNIASAVITTSFDCFIDQNAENYILRNNEGILITKPFKPLDWEVLTESKTIDGYLCYKAVYKKKIINMKNEEKIIPVTAWFSPSLPYSYGPKEFYGLPGLIIELEEGKSIFYASEISIFDLKKEIVFPKGKTITEEEYNKNIIAQKY